jgi:hypothetical protein
MKSYIGRIGSELHSCSRLRIVRIIALITALVAAAGVPLACPGAASAQGNDLQGLEVAADAVFIPTTVNSVSAGTVQAGFRTWYSFLWNRSPTTVTNATISVMSGYAPSLFDNVSAFPYTSTDPILASGQPYAAGNLWPKYTLPQNMIHVNYSLGFDSSRTVSPAVIPVGGTQQTLTITMTPVDSRYLTTANGHVGFNLFFRSNVPGVTVVSTTNPDNLNQGEQLQTPSNPPGLFQWQLGMPQLNKAYTFKAVLNVPNATGAPFAYQPEVQIDGATQTIVADNVSGPAVTVTDPTLDGNTPGSGSVTFSVAETNHLWQATHSDTWGLFYQGTEPAAPDPALHVRRIAAGANDERHAAAGVTFTDDDPAGNLSQYSGTIAWGDGSTVTIPKYLFTKIPARLGGGFAAGGLHTYARPGSYVVTVTINDVGGASDSRSTTLVVPSG